MVKRVTIVEMKVDEGSGDSGSSSSSGKVMGVTDATEVTNVVMVGVRKRLNLFGKR